MKKFVPLKRRSEGYGPEWDIVRASSIDKVSIRQFSRRTEKSYEVSVRTPCGTNKMTFKDKEPAELAFKNMEAILNDEIAAGPIQTIENVYQEGMSVRRLAIESVAEVNT